MQWNQRSLQRKSLFREYCLETGLVAAAGRRIRRSIHLHDFRLAASDGHHILSRVASPKLKLRRRKAGDSVWVSQAAESMSPSVQSPTTW